MFAAAALLLAFPFGLLLGLARVSPWKGLYWVATVWVYVLRGIPLLMVIFWTYFLVPLLIVLSGLLLVVVAVNVYTFYSASAELTEALNTITAHNPATTTAQP